MAQHGLLIILVFSLSSFNFGCKSLMAFWLLKFMKTRRQIKRIKIVKHYCHTNIMARDNIIKIYQQI